MAFAYSITNQHHPHFLTFTVEQWIDVFTRQHYVDIVLDSLRFCQQNKGLKIFSWCIMSNHIHLIVQSEPPFALSDTVRDFKKFTSRQLVRAIEQNNGESRQAWLLWLLHNQKDDKGKGIEFWQAGSHAEEIFSFEFYVQKMNYIHLNPVRAGYVLSPEEWQWSSAGNFYGRNGLLPLHYWNE
ncbi:MAG TPA: transposase [Phnomibacter sp.]|nr:transposase [Phnomibacter sp.]